LAEWAKMALSAAMRGVASMGGMGDVISEGSEIDDDNVGKEGRAHDGGMGSDKGEADMMDDRGS